MDLADDDTALAVDLDDLAVEQADDDTATGTESNVPPEIDSGLDFDDGLDFGTGAVDDGLDFGSTHASGLMRLTNRGTAPTMPVFTLYGPLINPSLTTAKGTLHYNTWIGPHQFVVIDPSVPSVLLGGTATRRELLYPANFEAFSIPAAAPDGTPGTLTVGLSHAGPVTYTGRVEARYRAAWF
jgi:hypothetical protein